MHILLTLNQASDDLEAPETWELALMPGAAQYLQEEQQKLFTERSILSMKVRSSAIFTDVPELKDFEIGTEYIEIYPHGFYYCVFGKYDSNISAEYEFNLGN